MSYIQPITKVCYALPCLTNAALSAPIDRLILALAEATTPFEVSVHKDYLGDPMLLIDGPAPDITHIVTVDPAGSFTLAVLQDDTYTTTATHLPLQSVLALLARSVVFPTPC